MALLTTSPSKVFLKSGRGAAMPIIRPGARWGSETSRARGMGWATCVTFLLDGNLMAGLYDKCRISPYMDETKGRVRVRVRFIASICS